MEELSGVMIVLIIGGGVLGVTICFIIAKRQIVRFTLRQRRGPHVAVGHDAKKSIKKEIERRIDCIHKIYFEPKLLWDDKKDGEKYILQPDSNLPPYYYRMKAMDDVKELEKEIAKQDGSTRHPRDSLRAFLLTTLAAPLNGSGQRLIHQFCDMYEHARHDPNEFGEEEYQAYQRLLKKLTDATKMLKSFTNSRKSSPNRTPVKKQSKMQSLLDPSRLRPPPMSGAGGVGTGGGGGGPGGEGGNQNARLNLSLGVQLQHQQQQQQQEQQQDMDENEILSISQYHGETDEINSLKKKHVELERRLKELTEYLGTKNNQLDTLKKRCEETKLQLTELAANEKRVAAIHDLEKVRYSKIRVAIEEHKEMLSRVAKRKMDHQQPIRVISPELASPNPSAYVSCTREFQLGAKERQLDDLKRLLEKREQEIVIKRNHNAARIVRLRKLLQSNEAKRTLCKEQLAALKAKTNRHY